MALDPARTSRPEWAGLTDSDLLARMGLRQEDPPSARAAWEEFYRRHAEYLLAVCLRAYGTLLGGEAGAADLAADTFQRAYEKADHFDAGGIADPQRLRWRARAWLGRIAQRLAQDILRGRARLRTTLLDGDQWRQIAREPAPEPGPRSGAQIDRVRRAIESLEAREQTVIRVTFQWYQPGEAHQRLANDVCADLAKTLRTTPENLRQIRRRAMKKIEAFLRAGGPAADGSEQA